MTTHEKFLGLVEPGGKKRRTSRIGMHPLHEAAMRLADIGFSRPRSKTKDLVGLLLSHGARTWRNSLPIATMRIKVFAPDGKPAIKIRL